MTGEGASENPLLLLAEQLAAIACEVSNLVAMRPVDRRALESFASLAVDTHLDGGLGDHWPFVLDPSDWPNAAAGDLRRPSLSPELDDRWACWRIGYGTLAMRNPRLALADAIEAAGLLGRPDRRALADVATLAAWVDAGVRLPLPWDATARRKANITEELYASLRELRSKTGGWVVWDGQVGARIFVANDQTEATSTSARHRARADAERLMKAFARGLGLEHGTSITIEVNG